MTAARLEEIREENALLLSRASERELRVGCPRQREKELLTHIDAVTHERNFLKAQLAGERKNIAGWIAARDANLDRALAAEAALATARNDALEAAAVEIDNKRPRPCDCETCYCGNQGDMQSVAMWDEADANAKRIRALAST